jgi:hypothetical protein
MANSLRSTAQAHFVLATIALVLAPIGSAQQLQTVEDAPAEAQATPLPEYMQARDGAADPEAISWGVAMWAFFNLVASLERETPSQGKQLILQSAVGLDEPSADKVVKHIARSMKQDERDTRALMAQQCRELRKVRLPVDQFASKLAAAEERALAHRERYFTQLFALLDETAGGLLTNWIDGNIRSNTKVIEVDYVRMFTEGGADSAAVLTALCVQSGVERSSN